MEQREPRLCSLAEFLRLPEDARQELIDGQLYMMAPPTGSHQDVKDEILVQLKTFLRGKRCRVRSEAGVMFDERQTTFVIPDIVVVCDPRKFKDGWIVGAPDMIAEVVSPSNSRDDRVKKFNLYLREGVREYWIVDPRDQSVLVSVLHDDHYITRSYGPDAVISVEILDGCLIDMSLVFENVPDEEKQH